MEELNLPEFINTEGKYNTMIHEINTLEKFEAIFLKLLSDESLELSNIYALMKIIQRDVILVNNLTEVNTLMEMTESFLRYSLMKNTESKTKDEHVKRKEEVSKEEKNPKILKKNQKKKKKTTPGYMTCDCLHADEN